ncbi:unnamed protein product [Urochloa humidicola]
MADLGVDPDLAKLRGDLGSSASPASSGSSGVKRQQGPASANIVRLQVNSTPSRTLPNGANSYNLCAPATSAASSFAVTSLTHGELELRGAAASRRTSAIRAGVVSTSSASREPRHRPRRSNLGSKHRLHGDLGLASIAQHAPASLRAPATAAASSAHLRTEAAKLGWAPPHAKLKELGGRHQRLHKAVAVRQRC